MAEKKETRTIKLPTLRRLPLYLRVAHEFREHGEDLVSGTHLSRELRLNPVKVRRDLSELGLQGKARVGYYVPSMIRNLEDFLGWNNTSDAFLIGVGSIGTALLSCGDFEERGANIVAAFDNDPEKIGLTVYGTPVLDLNKLPDLMDRLHIPIGIVAVSAEQAQHVTDLLVACGAKGIWNFAQTELSVPDHVVLQNEDITRGLAILSESLTYREPGYEAFEASS